MRVKAVAVPGAVSSVEELQQQEAAADANMAALLLEEAARKVLYLLFWVGQVQET